MYTKIHHHMTNLANPSKSYSVELNVGNKTVQFFVAYKEDAEELELNFRALSGNILKIDTFNN